MYFKYLLIEYSDDTTVYECISQTLEGKCLEVDLFSDLDLTTQLGGGLAGHIQYLKNQTNDVSSSASGPTAH